MLQQEVNKVFASIEKSFGGPCANGYFQSVYAEPKIPPSAFFLFMRRTKPKLEAKAGESQLLAHRLQKEWEQMDPKCRQEYEIEVSKLKSAYQDQRAEHRERGQYKIWVSSGQGSERPGDGQFVL